jgi:hypothetical protein
MLKDDIDKIIAEKCYVWDGSPEDVSDAIMALRLDFQCPGCASGLPKFFSKTLAELEE